MKQNFWVFTVQLETTGMTTDPGVTPRDMDNSICDAKVMEKEQFFCSVVRVPHRSK
jgi:hypothetical protein